MKNQEFHKSVEDALTKYGELLEQSTDGYDKILKELRILQRLEQELSWELLSDKEKHIKRIGQLNLMKKWETDQPDSKVNWIYEEKIIEFYELIVHTIFNIESNDYAEDINIFRLYNMLLVEKNFIDESRGFKIKRHYDFQVFTNIILDLENHAAFKQLRLQEIKEVFTEMYKAWDHNPYKEIHNS